ncbi:hypothetical protein CMI37_28125 [Candidatus Pacearchaeota archaeon]|nr:hypothetical protein [Candidatus Pacearchaeota archaeon]|tara:strand:+ start:7474 stop:8826 length:1353 start_codon:yes stop_codon:yes gene_type:complete
MEANEKIRGAVGVYSVYLAAKHDPNLVGRFSHSDGKSLVDGESRATKRTIADVMVYMAGRYGQQLTFEEVEMGLLAATPKSNSTKKRQKPGPNFDDIGKKYADKMTGLLTKKDIGAEIKDIINHLGLYDQEVSSYRTLEQAMGVALRQLGWGRKRQMTDGTRAYRWYPPDGFFDEHRPEVVVSEEEDVQGNGVDEVEDWDIESEVELEPIVEFSEVELEPTDKPAVTYKKKKRSGVKPDENVSARILTMNLYPGIRSYELALDAYDFIANDVEVPKSEEDMPHKVKLSIGATMKEIGWKKRTRRSDGIPIVGWYPPADWAFVTDEEAPAVETIRRALPEPPVEEAKPVLADSLPRLTKAAPELAEPEVTDDLPWPDPEEFSSEEDVVEKTTVVVKMVDSDAGTERVVERVIVMKNTGVYLLGTTEDPVEHMLEWDAEEEIWTCYLGSSEE